MMLAACEYTDIWMHKQINKGLLKRAVYSGRDLQV